MNNSLKKIISYIKKPWVIVGIVIVLFLIILIVRASTKSVPEELVKASRSTVQEEVSVTGKVKPASAVDLSFEKSGKVTAIKKEVGDTVVAGDVIVRLDSRDVAAQRAQSVAALRIQQSRLSELQKGTRPEEIALSQSKVTNAESDVKQAQNSLITALQASYSSADDAIRGKTDEMFYNPRTQYPQLVFQTDSITARTIQTGRVEVEKRLLELQSYSLSVNVSTSLAASSNIKQDLAEVKLFLDNLALVVNALPQNYSQANMASVTQWRADLSLARTQVNNAITAILTAENNVKQAQNSLTTLQGQLTIQQSGNVSDQIDAQAAQVAQASASVAAIDAQISKLTIISPINGVVTKQDAKIGETVIPNTNVVSIINNGQFDIEANLAEADISKALVGQQAHVTLDAYGSDVAFQAVVVRIDPAETVIDGVPTYKVVFQFMQADERVKSGMTANVDIIGDHRDNVIAIPERAVSNKNGKKYVSIKQGDKTIQIEVKTGLRGSDGSIEITQGINEGDMVVISR